MRTFDVHQWPEEISPGVQFLILSDMENNYMACPFCAHKPMVFTPKTNNRRGIARIGLQCLHGCTETEPGTSTEVIINHEMMIWKLRKAWHALLHKSITRQILEECSRVNPAALPKGLHKAVDRLLDYKQFMSKVPNE